jgi:hypothetical protein
MHAENVTGYNGTPVRGEVNSYTKKRDYQYDQTPSGQFPQRFPQQEMMQRSQYGQHEMHNQMQAGYQPQYYWPNPQYQQYQGGQYQAMGYDQQGYAGYQQGYYQEEEQGG